MTKKEARERFRAERLLLSNAQRLKLDDLILIQFQKLALPPLHTLLTFHPLEGRGEINTFPIAGFLQFRNPGLRVCYPKTNLFQNTMQAIAVTDDTRFETNGYGIAEPAGADAVDPQTIDAVLVPMLAFDEKGNRAGYGKGFYDRFLQQCRPGCLKIGLCYFPPVDALSDANAFDVPLTVCVTPHATYVF